MNKLNTTEEAVAELKNTIKKEIIEPTVLFCNKYIGLKMKIFLSIAATIYVFGLLIYSLYQVFNM
ncbi:hypothetical protein O3800_01745 [Gemella sanguinis]|jgi:hypothetical protein|uniref:hypothetical protein n=1 Tax=Gemella sanguinis TaxID=84135 RepID=UPI00352D5E6F